jgi:hypothetical protein
MRREPTVTTNELTPGTGDGEGISVEGSAEDIMERDPFLMALMEELQAEVEDEEPSRPDTQPQPRSTPTSMVAPTPPPAPARRPSPRFNKD